jgi:sugar O-acyltransferase (sialic acid O-acetyltransferase NeuD family)
MEIKKKYIFGASGHGKVVADSVVSTGELIEAFFDDAPNASSWNKIPIQHPTLLPKASDENEMVIAIGNNKTRKKISSRIADFNFFVVKHKTAVIASKVSIEEGTVVMANVVINSEANIGKHCIINTSAIIEHDCTIGDYVHVSPKAVLGGNVAVGEGTHIGIGATIIPEISIGKWATIGAGAVIIRDVPDYAVVVGNPGKIIKYNTIND